MANSISSPSEGQLEAFYAPFTGPSVYWLMSWFLTVSHSVSLTAIQSLVSNVIYAADFNASDFIGFSTMREAKHLDKYKTH
jgi:hypothetical protein